MGKVKRLGRMKKRTNVDIGKDLAKVKGMGRLKKEGMFLLEGV